jgi:hypothetical protein
MIEPFSYPPTPGQNLEFVVKMECAYVDVSTLPA